MRYWTARRHHRSRSRHDSVEDNPRHEDPGAGLRSQGSAGPRSRARSKWPVQNSQRSYESHTTSTRLRQDHWNNPNTKYLCDILPRSTDKSWLDWPSVRPRSTSSGRDRWLRPMSWHPDWYSTHHNLHVWFSKEDACGWMAYRDQRVHPVGQRCLYVWLACHRSHPTIDKWRGRYQTYQDHVSNLSYFNSFHLTYNKPTEDIHPNQTYNKIEWQCSLKWSISPIKWSYWVFIQRQSRLSLYTNDYLTPSIKEII